MRKVRNLVLIIIIVIAFVTPNSLIRTEAAITTPLDELDNPGGMPTGDDAADVEAAYFIWENMGPALRNAWENFQDFLDWLFG